MVNMIDIEDFVTTLFVLVDDFCQGDPPPPKPGPDCKFAESEAITLLIFSQWSRFSSERDFYRFAYKELRDAFPDLPSRPQLNRQGGHCMTRYAPSSAVWLMCWVLQKLSTKLWTLVLL